MIAHLLRAAPFPLTAVGILGGVALIASGRLPLAVAGAALIVLGVLVPFIRLSAREAERQAQVREPATRSTTQEVLETEEGVPASYNVFVTVVEQSDSSGRKRLLVSAKQHGRERPIMEVSVGSTANEMAAALQALELMHRSISTIEQRLSQREREAREEPA